MSSLYRFQHKDHQGQVKKNYRENKLQNMKYRDSLGNEYPSYEAYINSQDLDLDLIYLYLWQGNRIPQNQEEEKIKRELDEMKAKGHSLELNFE